MGSPYTNGNGVPTSAGSDNNHAGKKYTVNNEKPSGKLQIPKSVCIILGLGAAALAIASALVVYFTVPKCGHIKESQPLIGDRPVTAIDDVDPRLPTTVKPSYYRLEIVPDFPRQKIGGKVDITLKVESETTELILHVRDLNITQDSVTLKPILKNDTIGLQLQEYLSSERYRIVPNEILQVGTDYVLTIAYDVDFNSHLLGIYNSRYYAPKEHRTKSVVSTQFSPIDARRAFPCFDEPSFKSVFGINIARPINFSTISNMPQKGKPEPFENRTGWVWDRYQDTPPIPTYVVAFVISEFEHANTSRADTKLWTTPWLLPQTKYAADLTPRIVEFLEDYVNVTLPEVKLDLVAIPEFGFAAMENYGLITFRESMLLYDRNNTSIEDQKNIAHVLAHEIAHQWFGNLVTPKWWDDLWLKEGFASYFSYLAVEEVHPDWVYSQEMLPYELNRALSDDSYLNSDALAKDVTNNKEIRQGFGKGAYPKGACIARMLNHFLTEPTFKQGLNYYLDRYKYKNADRRDLFKCFDDAAADYENPFTNFTSVGEIMEDWVEKPGYPVIHIKTNRVNRTITLRQKRFFLNVDEGKDDNTTWWVPISVATDLEGSFDDASPIVWLKDEPVTLEIKFKEWFVVNVNQTGYYRVNYDENIWHSLIKNIMHVPPLTRAQLIGDSMELARANLLDYDIPLRLIAKMAVNDKLIMFIPTLMAFKKLGFLSDMLVNTPAFGLFEKYHTTIFKETYSVVDFDNTVDDYLSLRIMKTVLEWSCRSTDSKCAIVAHNLYRRWMQRALVIAPNMRHIVYCTAIRQGGKPEWDFAYHEFKRTNSPTEKNVLLDALGCTKHEWLLSRYLNIVLDDETFSMKVQDADRIFQSIAHNKAGNRLAFDFLRRNWKDIEQHLGEGFNLLNKLILSLPKHMNTEFQLAELQKFREELGNGTASSAAGPALDRAIEIVKSKVDWMKKNYKSLEQWLHAHQDKFDYL